MRGVVQVGLGIILILSLPQILPLEKPIADSAFADSGWNEMPEPDFDIGRLHDVVPIGGGPTGVQGLALSFGGKWTKMAPPTQPYARRGHGLASIYGTDEVLLFGGYFGGYHLNDTWVYDLGDDEWTRIYPPSTKPEGRHSHAMASIYATDKVLLFGGYNGSGYAYDTWVYDLSDNVWIEILSQDGPSGRVYHDMASIYDDDKAVLFGGYDGSDYVNDTWVFDLSDSVWTPKAPHAMPSARKGHEMATVHGTDEIVLFGGNVSGTVCVNDTWLYDLSDDEWTDMNPSGDKPSARRGHVMASFYETDQVLLFGPDHETWIYDVSDNTWTLETPPENPSPRYIAHGMAAIYDDDKMVLFGGGFYDISWHNYNDTWVYDLSPYEEQGPYGSPSYDIGSESSIETPSLTIIETSPFLDMHIPPPWTTVQADVLSGSSMPCCLLRRPLNCLTIPYQ